MGLREGYRAFNTALDLLYKNETLNLADKKPFKFKDKVFMDAAQKVYDEGGFDLPLMNTPEAKAVIAETARILSEAISSGIPHEVPATLRYALENNAFIFSGFKTFHSLREVGLSMVTEKGYVKPFEEFLVDVKKVNEKYNQNYLYAEYNHAVGTSLMAVKWNDFTQDGDRYNLQYRTAGDDRVREEHAVLHGITLPINDPFWDKYFPPNGWNCRCTVVQVRKNKYPTSDPAKAMEAGDNCTSGIKREMFRYNPGKTIELFPPKHPYKKVPKAAKKVIKKLSEEELKEKRISELRSMLPDNLSSQEKDAKAANNYDIETMLGIKINKPMSVEEADKQSANPHYKDNYFYQINCQTCSPAYALRLMGFDITAKANTQGSLSEYLSRQRSFEAWTNIDGSPSVPILTFDWMISKGYKQMSPKRYKEYFQEACPETGVYILTIGWKGGGGHATILQRFPNGELKYIEPQVYSESIGAKRGIEELCNAGGAKPYPKRGILRVDNKLFNTKFISIFDK